MFGKSHFLGKRKSSIMVNETELFSFFERGSATENEIAGALVGLEKEGIYYIINIFNYRPTESSESKVNYHRLPSSFLPAGLDNLGTIHTHPNLGAFLSPADEKELRKGNHVVFLVMDPYSLELKGFEKSASEIPVAIVNSFEIRINTYLYIQYNTTFSIFATKMDGNEKLKIKSDIDRRYDTTQVFGFNDLISSESQLSFNTPKVIFLKYKDKVPLQFFIKNETTYGEWFDSFMENTVLELIHTYAYLSINGGESGFLEDNREEKVNEGTSRLFLY